MSKLQKAQTQQGHSKSFFEFIRAIGEAKSKQEEDRIITKDVAALKIGFAEKGVDNKTMKEMVIRMLYCEMLGHPVDFGHIHAVNLVSATDLHHKKAGYLATWLTVSPDHEFMYLMVSTLQRDLKSANFLEVSAALTSAAKLIKNELMTSLNPEILTLMNHTNPLVRKKVVNVMHSFYRKSDGTLGDPKTFRQALCDRDASVMGAALCLLLDVTANGPQGQRDLLPSFINILKQITEHRLSREFDYHRIPAPWLQIKLLRLLNLIAADDRQLSEKCSEVLGEVMKRADTGLNIGHAVIFEAISTITSLYPIPELMEAAADAISKFLASSNSNLKYLGITALSRIVRIDPKYAIEHQHIVIDCLEDSDDTIRRKTLNLLYAMANENNVEAIAARLIRFLAEATDNFLRQDLVRNICNICERYASSQQWYIDAMNKLLEVGADHVRQDTVQGMLKMIAEGQGEDEEEDAEFRIHCVDHYFNLVESPDKQLPAALYQIIAWVLGEYGFLSSSISREMILDRLCDMIERQHHDADTKGWILTALMKVVAHNGFVPDNIEDIVQKLRNSESVSLQQRAYEFQELVKSLPILKKVLPLDGCCEDIEVDADLSFLDSIVEDAVSRGAKRYEKKQLNSGPEAVGLKTEAYKAAQQHNVVDMDELDHKKFNEEQEEKLVIRDTAKKWGAANLDQEAAIEQPVQSDIPMSDGEEHKPGTPSAAHVDPTAMGDEPIAPARKATKNEKFVSNLFGGGTKRKKPRANRATESAKRYEKAQAALQGQGDESAEEEEAPIVPAPAPKAAAKPVSPSPQASSSSAARIEFNIQKRPVEIGVQMRVGILANANLERIVVTIRPPPVTDMQIAPVPGSQVSDNTVNIPAIEKGKPLFVDVMLRPSGYPMGGGLAVQVSFSSSSGPGSANGGLPLGLTDILRPAVSATTEVFGGQWVKHSGEHKVQLKFPGPVTPEQLGQFLGAKASVKIVQVIGRECIAAAFVAHTKQWLLVHMNVDGATVNTTVRSESKPFSTAVGEALVAALPK